MKNNKNAFTPLEKRHRRRLTVAYGNLSLTGFTLVEMLIVVGIFTLIFVASLSVLVISNNSWRIGRTQQQLQQEARKAISAITNDLREASFDWGTQATDDDITINALGDSITFYVPVYDANDNIISKNGILYYLGAQNPQTLYRKVGSAASVAVATNINNVANEKPFFWFEPNTNNQVIAIKIPVIVNTTTSNMTSKVTVRNNIVADVPVDNPGQGEY